ncbi:hypothetical protein IKP13_08475 [bacterium]|jgi:hypothetical protein|nr:hypothetical protein [bacterium]
MKKDNSIGYLGPEFLFWIFWKSATEETLSLNNLGLGEIRISIEDSITLASLAGNGYCETIKSPEILTLPSVRESIKQGRLPEAAKVRISSSELEWSFQVKAIPFKISSVKLPITGEKNENSMISVRLIAMTKLELILKALFNTFLLERESLDFIDDIKDFLGIAE